MDVRRYRGGRSPFDDIMHVEDDGTEWWSAREMMEPLGYTAWHNMQAVVSRARAACRSLGVDHTSIFTDVVKYSEVGGKSGLDVHMRRFGCYMVALSGDSTKPEIAAAKRYFAAMTRAAELGIARPPDADLLTPRPWSVRFRESTQEHFCYMSRNHLGYFSVVSATVPQMLMMEEELMRHLLPLKPSDLPDGSIGQHWAKYRWAKRLPPSNLRAPLLLPDRGVDAQVLIYPVAELGDFLRWLTTSYLPEHLPKYFLNKPDFKPYGELPSASAADNTCKKITGVPAQLAERARKQLDSVGGFCPVGWQLPSPRSPQRGLFDGLD